MSLESFSSSDAILHIPSGLCPKLNGPDKHGLPALIFFLTGNPGMISYYDKFLSSIAQPYSLARKDGGIDPTTSPKGPGQEPIVAGFSLGGFATSESSSPSTSANPDRNPLPDSLSFPPLFQQKDVYSLRDQIELCYARLEHLTRQIHEHYHGTTNSARGDHTSQNDTPVKVVLVGHSVGAYIALELIRLHHARSRGECTRAKHRFNITGSILLTPTVVNISRSPSGRIATPVLSYLPFLPHVLQLLSSGVATLVPERRLAWLVSSVTGMREGSHGLKATVDFLRCRGAVRQALLMARDEMLEIREDRWGSEVWGVAGEDVDTEEDGRWMAPKLYFWFAKQDHWVADLTRDELVKALRGSGEDEIVEGGATVVVDENDGLVHAWCLEQSELVASRVRGWIGEILCQE